MTSENDSGTKTDETRPKQTKTRPRKPPGSQGSSYKLDSAHYLRVLVDKGATVKVSLRGQPNGALTGKLVGFDAYSYFLDIEGVIYLVHKGSSRYIVPVG